MKHFTLAPKTVMELSPTTMEQLSSEALRITEERMAYITERLDQSGIAPEQLPYIREAILESEMARCREELSSSLAYVLDQARQSPV
jgi:hypothetical protein